MELRVNLGKDSYDIRIQRGILESVLEQVSSVFQGKQIAIISDENVFSHYGDDLIARLSERFSCHSILVPAGEASKDFSILPSIYERLLEAKLSRTDLILALGGGVIGDMAGFVAASYLRGISFIQIPTSLLAQVDSSVGGKVAVDLVQGKNLVGAFYQPKLVLIDPTVLQTLPHDYLVDGMGEVIKYACIFDKDLYEKLYSFKSYAECMEHIEEVIYTCVNHKRRVVEEDAFDRGSRLLLNFGHTIGHAIEQYKQYQGISHGQAVSIGMVEITQMAEMKGLSKKGTANQIKELLSMYELPTENELPLSLLTKAIGLDKKNLDSQLQIILLHEMGEGYIYKEGAGFFEEPVIRLGILGEVLGHSQSPELSEMISKQMQIKTSFQLIEMPRDKMDDIMDYLKKLCLTGLSVTIPYKQLMMEKVDELSPAAQEIGALNCIHFKNGKTYGYNTDFIGFSKMLEHSGVNVKNKEVVVLGAGGACRGVIYALYKDGAKKITVVGRRKEQLDEIQARFPYITTCLFAEIGSGDILVQTTSVGMYPKVEDAVVGKEVVERFEVIVDIVYNPLMTKLLQMGKELGKQTVTGFAMLEEQAIAAHEIWLKKGL